VTAEQIIRAFEIEAFVVFVVVGVVVWRQSRRAGRLTPLGAAFVGGLAVAFFGDPVANWGLTALYSDQFHLLPRWMGWGLSPAQSWACVFAYPWCFPMLAYAGRWVARRSGATSALTGFACGAAIGCANFVASVPMTFVPHQVIVYQQAPPFPLTLWAGTPAQVQLLDVLGITMFVGLFAAALMPGPGESRFERWLPAGRGRAAMGAALLLGTFLACFSPALAVRALGLDTQVAFTKSPFPTVPLYGQVEAYPPQVVENYLRACVAKGGDTRLCQCSIDAVRRRFTIDEYRTIETRITKGELPRELLAAVDDCRY
jgi:hypothetical protein